jgi:protein-tyrosine phosphatase
VAPSSPQLRPERTLRWEGCCNIRDLGGLPLEDGGETRFGAIVRADDISLLSDEGREAMAEYGVVRIVDLRHEDPSYASAIELVRLPLFDAVSILEVDELLADVDDPVTWRRRNYLFFLDRFRTNFASAVSQVASAPDGTVLVHCAGGIDRTGLVSALLLRVAGVGIEAIAEDYAESAAGWAHAMDPWIAEAPDAGERRKRTLLSIISAQTMRHVLVDLEREHDSAYAFLVSGSAEPDALERLRERLRG